MSGGRVSTPPSRDVAGACPSLGFKLPRRERPGKQAQSKRSRERKLMPCVCARGVCARGVCTWCVCAWCACVCGVCVRGVRVRVVCVCTWCVCAWCVCAWYAHMCGCVCVQREHNPVTMANTAHTWAGVVTSRPGHRTWSEVSRLWPRGRSPPGAVSDCVTHLADDPMSS